MPFKNESAPEAVAGPKDIENGVSEVVLTTSSTAVRVTVIARAVEVKARGTAGEEMTREGREGDIASGRFTVPPGETLMVTVNVAVDPSTIGDAGVKDETVNAGSLSTIVIVVIDAGLENDPGTARVGERSVTIIFLSPLTVESSRSETVKV